MLTTLLYAFALLVPGLLMWVAHPLLAIAWIAGLLAWIVKPLIPLR